MIDQLLTDLPVKQTSSKSKALAVVIPKKPLADASILGPQENKALVVPLKPLSKSSI